MISFSMIMDNIKTIYCDFDGTVTKKDAVNTFFEMYADKKWLEYEEMWVQHKISSMENAIKQVALIAEVTPSQLDDYINSIEIDEYFKEFVDYLTSKGIELVILSDGFDLFIEKTLQRLNISNVKYYANHLIYKNNKFSIEFPHHNKKCDIGAGMCKCAQVKEKDFCFIGDGNSDLCVAKKAKFLFASKYLLQYCKANGINHVPFESFRDIMKKLKTYGE